MTTPDNDHSGQVAAAAAQMVEHVAEDGSVIEIVTRAEMRARTLRHRSVFSLSSISRVQMTCR